MSATKKIIGVLEKGAGIVLGDTPRSNHDIIREQDDFPSPTTVEVDGVDKTVYELEAGVEYEINGLVQHDYPLYGNGQQLKGSDWGADILYYTGEDSQLIYRDVPFFTRDISFMAPNGQCLDLKADNTVEFLTQDCAILQADSLGVVDGYKVPSFKDFSMASYNEGLTFLGDPLKVFMHSCPVRDPNGGTTAIKLDGANGFSPELIHFEALFAEGFNADDQFIEVTGDPVGNYAVVSSVTSEFNLENRMVGLSRSDPKWQFSGNTDVPDSSISGIVDQDGSNTVTITAGDGDAGNPKQMTPISSSNYLDKVTEGDGTLTYQGEKGRYINANLNISMAATGGSQLDVAVYVGSNGVYKEDGSQTVTLDNGGGFGTATAEMFIDVTKGDEIQAFIENKTNTDDIEVTDMDLIVRRA